ncbi:MAG: type I-F CRISPR-associated helicase Cas3f [Pyramidobacter sp.]|jgi:CRISPR-associated endonuclease/helicase Cas3
MMVLFTSRSEKKARDTVRDILDNFADRIGNDTWQTVMTEDGLRTVKALLRRHATKNMAVACRWIRSRNCSELLFVVGDRSRFNDCGCVPVNTTSKNLIHSEWENDWTYAPLIKALAALGGLFHDMGKASDYFQHKLQCSGKWKKMDPLRHEWVSCKLLEALVKSCGAESDDRIWLTALVDGKLHSESLLSAMSGDRLSIESAKMPPLACFLSWLILSHHRLPSTDGARYDGLAKNSFADMLKSIDGDWGYHNVNGSREDLEQCFTFSKGLFFEKGSAWKKQIVKWCGRMLKEYENFLRCFEEERSKPAFRVVAALARLSMMLADHFISSQPDEKGTWQSVKLWANTDPKTHKKKQFLEEHLVRVASQAVKIAHSLPYFSDHMESACDHRELKQKSSGRFVWQDKVVGKIKAFRERRGEQDGFFVVNMASTGCGKTFANAKILQALSSDGDSLRYILALGLRSLTLQTGDEYRKRIHLDENELAVLIGSAAMTELHEEDQKSKKRGEEMLRENNNLSEDDFRDDGDEIEETLLTENVQYLGAENESSHRFLDIFLADGDGRRQRRAAKNRAFLYKPVLVATIDHVMGATETVRGGRYILPTLRLLSSDLVIDEIDDFGKKDLIAISRLVHLAGMFGRNVVLSSATLPPDLAEGMYRVYRAGLECSNLFFNKRKHAAVVLCDEFNAEVQDMDAEQFGQYMAVHNRFVKKRVKKLEEQPVRRRGIIVHCASPEKGASLSLKEGYFEEIARAAEELHRNNCSTDSRSGKKISFGVVRMAQITPCVELSLFLMKRSWPDDMDVRVMTYHSQQILLLRHEQEHYLDGVLRRTDETGSSVDIADNVLRRHINSNHSPNLLFIVVATPVEEVGRDHDFDWAVVEPSSSRSIIQLGGRVLRHREKTASRVNIAIMQYNLWGLEAFHRLLQPRLRDAPVSTCQP